MLVPDKKLNSGHCVPVMGFATTNLTKENAMVAMKTAIDSGCRHIDCSVLRSYEKDIGNALHRIISGGAIKRSELYLSSKYSPTGNSTDNIRNIVNATIANLQTDYLDLLLLQDPSNTYHSSRSPAPELLISKQRSFDFVQMWKELEKLHNEGLVRSIGLSNFKEFHIEKILEDCTIVPAIHQVNAEAVEEPHVEFCKQRDIAVSAYTPLRQRPSSTRSLIHDRSILKEVATKHGKTTAQVNIRAQIQRGFISVVESVKLAQIRSKFQIFDFELDSSEMTAILALDKKQRHASTDGQEVRLIDLIDEKPTIHHRQWKGGRLLSEASES